MEMGKWKMDMEPVQNWTSWTCESGHGNWTCWKWEMELGSGFSPFLPVGWLQSDMLGAHHSLQEDYPIAPIALINSWTSTKH